MGALAQAAFDPASRSRAPENFPVLLLNADYRPLSYYPLSLAKWQDAITAVFLGRANVVAEYDTVVSSPSVSMHIPSVIALNDYRRQPKYAAFTRFNVFLRDEFRCAYCGTPYNASDLTFDHVIPRKDGGKTTWKNIATACMPCNTAKASATIQELGWQMPRLYRPKQTTLARKGRKFPPNHLHKTWQDFLYWDAKLEP